ncbi:hypothetical protein AJ80_07867 [Polytolypa hystricis UAMH7299]|uniref:Glycoprotease family protein n=1 Tax=Polytolypa hystricis (strain UAMH7299) TaxID=1447883 RepID=A0A2B7XIM4_POLH7|nr:hypothetical protein AJ80_07867 [Polytolypa hystricis UAMH7299]
MNNTISSSSPAGLQPPSRNQTLPSSQFRPPPVPDFPFSSPITEEVTTPYHSSSDGSPPLDEYQHHSNPFDSPEDHLLDKPAFERSTTLDGLIKQNSRWNNSRRTSIRKQTRRGSVKDSPAGKKQRPGLNLVTNFSSDRKDGVSKRMQQAATDASGFVDWQDLRSLGRGPGDVKRTISAAKKGVAWRKGATRIEDGANMGQAEPTKYAANPAIEALRASPSLTHDLSPSDRPIVIGISMPVSQTPHNIKVDGTPTPKQSPSLLGQCTPVTPTIIITPAAEEAPWNHAEDRGRELRAPRPASSIYSQPTPRPNYYYQHSSDSVPPVPTIPASHSFGNGQTDDPFSERSQSLSRKRAFSTGTVFEDDDSPLKYSRSRSLSNEAQSARYSIDTLATRHRSQGWWNVLLSPFLSRSNTIASRRGGVGDDVETPAVPSMFVTAPKSPKHAELAVEKAQMREVSTFSPDTPWSGEEKKIEHAPWPGTSHWDRLRGGDVDYNPHSQKQVSSSPPLPQNKSPNMSPASLQSIPLMMSSPDTGVGGYAAEYYNKNNNDSYFGGSNTSFSDRGSFAITQPPTTSTSAAFTPHDSHRGIGAVALGTSPTNSNNPFFQRFVASIRNGDGPRPRSTSESTVIEDEPDFSPNVREARVAPVLRAASVATGPTPSVHQEAFTQNRRESTRNSQLLPAPPAAVYAPGISNERTPTPPSQHPPPYSPPQRRYRAIFPPGFQQPPQPQSPGPLSPGAQNMMASRGGIPMSTMRSDAAEWPPRDGNVPAVWTTIEATDNRTSRPEARRQRHEREDAIGKKVGGLWRGRFCFPGRGCSGRPGREGRKKRRCYAIICILLLLIILLSVLLAVFLTRKPQNESTDLQSRWLNLTGYPPMPTGIATIAGADPVIANSACIRPETMWSCALPKEEHDANKPYDADSPKFRVHIRFKNGTYPRSTGVEQRPKSRIITTKRARSISLLDVLTGMDVYKRALAARIDEDDFTPKPRPPALEDMTFLGQTTDNVTGPTLAGEETPFYIDIFPSTSSSRGLGRRATAGPHDDENDHSNSSNNDSNKDKPPTNLFPNLTSIIPPPSIAPDGTANLANLYPLPVAQPLRLFDRGLSTEHYGFYTYFDRGIFLKSTSGVNASANDDALTGDVPDDENGGSTRSAARVRCTWAQTRFLVRIWTRGIVERGITLVPPSPGTSSPPSDGDKVAQDPHDPTSSLSTSFSRPGTFPYPISISLDRHGGSARDKMVYCYGIDEREKFIQHEKKLQIEQRGVGGKLIEPASGIFDLPDDDDDEKSKGENGDIQGKGVDGGTGGCRCEWRNWVGEF